jgi:hypothetical protein
LVEEKSAERQRVFLIEEKARRTPESFLDRGKGLPDARGRSPEGSFLSWKRNPIRTRAPEALASGTFFVPFAQMDQLVRIGKIKTKLLFLTLLTR